MKKIYLSIVCLFLTLSFIKAQTSSTASELASKMTVGWNIGNSLEVPDGETAWGNPKVTQTLIDAVSDAGFNTVRIPCAWDSYANESSHEVDADWLERVKEVVDYCYNNDMYVVLNSHWDNGWLEENPTYDEQDDVNEKQEAYWTQIAEYFEDYDEHLLFAGTNEVHYDYNDPSDENIEVQESYNQTFVDAVRATGGNNATRVLIVQTYNTNAWYGLNYMTMPDDDIENKLMVEIHYYDPYNFTLNSDDSSACTLWGDEWSDGDVCSWGQEDYMDDLFDQVKSLWIDNDIPVIIGEFGVIKRTDLTGDEYTEHVESREYYLNYLTSDAKEYGLIPIYWDNGVEEYGMGLFDRSSGDVIDEGALDAIISGAGATPSDDSDNSSDDSDDTDDEASIVASATAGDGYVTLTWSTENIDIRNIQIMRDTDSDPSGRSRIATPGTSETSYTDTDVTNGTTYYYWVKIVDTDIVSYNSDAVGATPTSSDDSSISLTASSGNGYVALNWSTSNIDIRNIQIYRDTDSNPSGRTRIGTAGSDDTSYTDSDVTNGTTYYYWVKIVDTDLVSYNSDAASATPVSTSTSSFEGTTLSSEDTDSYTVSLNQNYPNPFTESTTITFTLEEDAMVSLNIYDITGNLVNQPINGTLQKGTHAIEINASSLNLNKGVYFYKLITPSISKTKTMSKN